MDRTVPDVLGRLLTGCFAYREPIHILEALSLLWAVKHELRSSKVLGSELQVLTDSTCVSLAISQGRAHDHKFLTVIRRISASCLTGALRLRVLWFPSERNPSDEPSRG